MNAGEYLTFVPLMLYGIGLADLLSQWKRMFNPEEWFAPYSLMTIILTETAVYNLFIYLNLVEELNQQHYLNYLSYLFPPFTFLMATNAFTPDEGAQTETYFNKHRKTIFILLAVFIASHFLYHFDENSITNYGRMVFIGLCAIMAFTKKYWPIYVVFFLWLISFYFRGYVVVN